MLRYPQRIKSTKINCSVTEKKMFKIIVEDAFIIFLNLFLLFPTILNR